MQLGKKSRRVTVPGGIQRVRVNCRYANFVCIVSPRLTVAIPTYLTDFHCYWVLVCWFSFLFWYFDPPLSHLPGAVWSHTVAFPRLAAENGRDAARSAVGGGTPGGNSNNSSSRRRSALWHPAGGGEETVWHLPSPVAAYAAPTVQPCH